MLDAVAPATRRFDPFAATVPSRTVSTRSSVAVLSGLLVGVTAMIGDRLVFVVGRLADLGDVFELRELGRGRFGGGGAAARGQLGDHGEHAVGAGAEALRDQVVGLTLGFMLRRGPLARQAEAHVQHRDRQHQEDDRGDDGGDHPVTGDQADPALTERLVGAPRAFEVLALQRPLAGEAEQGRDQGQRDQDRDHDRARGGQAHRGKEGDAADGERGERDRDGGAGEDHGATRGPDRVADRLFGLHPLGHPGPVPGDDEERVVDPDRKPQHRRQRAGGRAERGQRGEGGDPEDAGADADHRGQERQARGQERAEGDRQDDQGDDDPDQPPRPRPRRLFLRPRRRRTGHRAPPFPSWRRRSAALRAGPT